MVEFSESVRKTFLVVTSEYHGLGLGRVEQRGGASKDATRTKS
jgi:hypothetical protein